MPLHPAVIPVGSKEIRHFIPAMMILPAPVTTVAGRAKEVSEEGKKGRQMTSENKVK